MKNILSRKLLFYMFADDELVNTATGWTREQSDEFSDHTPPMALSTATFEAPGRTDGIYAVHDALTLLTELSIFSLQSKVDEIESNAAGYLDLSLGYLPVAADNYDLIGWARRPVWTPDEAACISLGFNPTTAVLEIIYNIPEPYKIATRLFKEVFDRSDIIVQANRSGRLDADGSTVDIMRWFLHLEMAMPKQLANKVIQFHSAPTELGPDEFSTEIASDDDLGNRERNTLLKMIAAMAVEQYNYDPSAARSDVAKNIEHDLDSVGLHLDQKTINKWLKIAAKQIDDFTENPPKNPR